MNYLKYNKQEGQKSSIHKLFTSILSKKAEKVTGIKSHMSFFLYYFLQQYPPFRENKKIKIVDIGGANGSYLAYHNKNTERFIIDLDDLYSEELKSKGVHFKKCDLEKDELPFETNSVDLIMMNHVLEHLRDPAAVLNKIHKILKKEGLLIIRVPDISKVKWKFYCDYTHITPFVKEKLKSTLISSKFDIQYIDNFNYERFMGSFLISNKPSLIWSKFGNEIIAIVKK